MNTALVRSSVKCKMEITRCNQKQVHMYYTFGQHSGEVSLEIACSCLRCVSKHLQKGYDIDQETLDRLEPKIFEHVGLEMDR